MRLQIYSFAGDKLNKTIGNCFEFITSKNICVGEEVFLDYSLQSE